MRFIWSRDNLKLVSLALVMGCFVVPSAFGDELETPLLESPSSSPPPASPPVSSGSGLDEAASGVDEVAGFSEEAAGAMDEVGDVADQSFSGYVKAQQELALDAAAKGEDATRVAVDGLEKIDDFDSARRALEAASEGEEGFDLARTLARAGGYSDEGVELFEFAASNAPVFGFLARKLTPVAVVFDTVDAMSNTPEGSVFMADGGSAATQKLIDSTRGTCLNCEEGQWLTSFSYDDLARSALHPDWPSTEEIQAFNDGEIPCLNCDHPTTLAWIEQHQRDTTPLQTSSVKNEPAIAPGTTNQPITAPGIDDTLTTTIVDPLSTEAFIDPTGDIAPIDDPGATEAYSLAPTRADLDAAIANESNPLKRYKKLWELHDKIHRENEEAFYSSPTGPNYLASNHSRLGFVGLFEPLAETPDIDEDRIAGFNEDLAYAYEVRAGAQAAGKPMKEHWPEVEDHWVEVDYVNTPAEQAERYKYWKSDAVYGPSLEALTAEDFTLETFQAEFLNGYLGVQDLANKGALRETPDGTKWSPEMWWAGFDVVLDDYMIEQGFTDAERDEINLRLTEAQSPFVGF